MPGASVENPAHGKGHEEEAWWAKARSGLKGPPGPSWASTPKPESVFSWLSPTPLTLTGGYPQPPFSGENQLRALAKKSPGHERNLSNSTPLCWHSSLSDRYIQPLAATRMIIQSLPAVRSTGSLKHSKNIEPFKELKAIRVVLV